MSFNGTCCLSDWIETAVGYPVIPLPQEILCGSMGLFPELTQVHGRDKGFKEQGESIAKTCPGNRNKIHTAGWTLRTGKSASALEIEIQMKLFNVSRETDFRKLPGMIQAL